MIPNVLLLKKLVLKYLNMNKKNINNKLVSINKFCVFLIGLLCEIKDTYLYEDDTKTLVNYDYKCLQINECIETTKIIQFKLKKIIKKIKGENKNE